MWCERCRGEKYDVESITIDMTNVRLCSRCMNTFWRRWSKFICGG